MIAGLSGTKVRAQRNEILKSRALAEKVADKLKIDEWPEFNWTLASRFFDGLLHPLVMIGALQKLTTPRRQ